jgi:cation:H+ antiporter
MNFLIPPENIAASFLYISLGFFFLIKGADLFINSAIYWAYKFKIPESFIGLTLVAFGTSAPELFTTTQAAFIGKYDIAMSNILGSNIFNLLFIVGLSAFAFPTTLNKKYFLWQMRWMFGFGILVFILCWNLKLRFYESIILIFMYFIFLFLSSKVFKSDAKETNSEIKTPVELKSTTTASIFFFIGLSGLLLGSKLALNGGQQFAALIGLSDRFLGLIILALGTSLPEAVASLVASYKGHKEMAFANVIGSNASNLLCVLGLSSLTTSFVISERIVFLDLILFIVFSVFLLTAGSLLKFKLNRAFGFTSVLIYFLYVHFFIVQN